MATYRYSRTRYRRHFYRRRDLDGVKLLVGGSLAIAIASAGGVATGHAVASAIKSHGSYTPQTWAAAFLAAAGEPATACNKGFVVAWERAEGGNWGNNAAYNPLNDTRPETGSHAINYVAPGVGVQAYTSWGQGLAATVTTIRYYPGILAALSAGNDAQQAANAVAMSPWGTSSFEASC